METLFHIILGLLGLSFIVLIHELGHFLAARSCKVEVERVCLFLGKPLVAWRWCGTEFAVAWLPLGGYCKMRGEGLALQQWGEEDSEVGIQDSESQVQSDRKSFQDATSLQKIFIAAAGPLINIIFAFLVLFLFQLFGHPDVRESNRVVVLNTSEVQVSDILPQTPSPAEMAGLQSGDVIVRIGNHRIDSFQDLRLAIALSAGQTLNLEYLRDGQPRRGVLHPAANKEGRGWIGVISWRDLILQDLQPNSRAAIAGLKPSMKLEQINGQTVANWYELLSVLRDQQLVGELGGAGAELVSLWRDSENRSVEVKLSLADLSGLEFLSKTWVQNSNLLQAAGDSLQNLTEILSMQLKGLHQLLQGRLALKDNLAGPIQISDQIGKVMTGVGASFAERWYSSWQFLSFISFMIALANLLPLAVLDGGQILLYSIELLGRRRLPFKWVAIYQSFGGVVVIGLMVVVLGFELWHYIL